MHDQGPIGYRVDVLQYTDFGFSVVNLPIKICLHLEHFMYVWEYKAIKIVVFEGLCATIITKDLIISDNYPSFTRITITELRNNALIALALFASFHIANADACADACKSSYE